MVIPIVNVKYLWKINILRFITKSFLSINLKWVTCVPPGPWKHTRGLGAVLEMEVQKEKIKNVSILWWSSWRQILKLYIPM